jgi:hypothetical protein
MDFNTTIDIIIKDLREAREIIDDLKNYPGVPRLQVELARSKCKSAEEVIALLKTIQAENVNPVAEKKITEPVVAEPVKIKAEPLIEISEDEESEVTAHQPVGDSDAKLQKHPEPKKKEASIIADRFSDMPDTIHESFGKISPDEDISSLIKSKPVLNLSEAIGINDKFLFIREVFGGSHSNYDEAISKLNKVENLADAKAVIMSYTGESDENEVVVQLLSLVKRKLSSDG